MTTALRSPTPRAVAPLGIGAFAIGTDLFVVAGVLPGLAADLDVPVGAAGLTVTVFALAFAVGAPVLGALLGGRSTRRVLVGSLVLFAVCNVGSALAPGLALLLATRVLAALAASAYAPAAGAAAVAAVPEGRRGRALGVVLAGSALATVLGAHFGVLLAALGSWRAAFWLVALLAAATVVALVVAAGGIGAYIGGSRFPLGASRCVPYLRRGPLVRSGVGAGPSTRSTLPQRLGPLRSPAVRRTLAVTFLVMAASNSTYTYLGVLVDGTAGLGLLIAAFGLAGMVGTWWGGTAVDRLGSGRVAVVAVIVLAMGFAALPHVGTAGTFAVVAGWGTAAWAFVAAQQHRVIGLGPAPLLLALNSSAIHLGFAAGALLGGFVVDSTGPASLWFLPVACCAAGLILHGRKGARS